MSGEGLLPFAPPSTIDSTDLDEALPQIREAVLSALPDPPSEWVERLRGGLFDSGPLMVAGIACWAFARGWR